MQPSDSGISLQIHSYYYLEYWHIGIYPQFCELIIEIVNLMAGEVEVSMDAVYHLILATGDFCLSKNSHYL